MATHAAAGLSELVLSSTHAASPLPTISLHNPLTGALVYSFRSPVASTSHAASTATASTRNGINNAADKDQPSLENRTTFAAVEGSQGCGGYLVGLGGKEGRAGLNVWNFTRVRSNRLSSLRPSFLQTSQLVADLSLRAGNGPASIDPAREAHDYDCQPRWNLHGRRNSGRSHLSLGGESCRSELSLI